MLGHLLMSDHFSWKIFLDQIIKLALYLIDKTCMNEIVKLCGFGSSRNCSQHPSISVRSGLEKLKDLQLIFKSFLSINICRGGWEEQFLCLFKLFSTLGLFAFVILMENHLLWVRPAKPSPNCTVPEIDSKQHWNPRYDNSILRRINFQNHCYCLNLKA